MPSARLAFTILRYHSLKLPFTLSILNHLSLDSLDKIIHTILVSSSVSLWFLGNGSLNTAALLATTLVSRQHSSYTTSITAADCRFISRYIASSYFHSCRCIFIYEKFSVIYNISGVFYLPFVYFIIWLLSRDRRLHFGSRRFIARPALIVIFTMTYYSE